MYNMHVYRRWYVATLTVLSVVSSGLRALLFVSTFVIIITAP